jgi:hypothetical protein
LKETLTEGSESNDKKSQLRAERSKGIPMGDYLLLQWLGTRRGLAVFVLLLLVTVFSNLEPDR